VLAFADLVLEEGLGVDHECVAQEVDELATGADRVGPAQEEGVVEVPVDRFGVVAGAEQVGEVGITGRDGTEVLCAVQLPCPVSSFLAQVRV
jgi:hypothetical protein